VMVVEVPWSVTLQLGNVGIPPLETSIENVKAWPDTVPEKFPLNTTVPRGVERKIVPVTVGPVWVRRQVYGPDRWSRRQFQTRLR